jgi:hypothetical protein
MKQPSGRVCVCSSVRVSCFQNSGGNKRKEINNSQMEFGLPGKMVLSSYVYIKSAVNLIKYI